MKEGRETNSVFGKTLTVLGHAELFEPIRNPVAPGGFNSIRSGPASRSCRS
jgi:hypothetical protein